jgi:hypothetical protein
MTDHTAMTPYDQKAWDQIQAWRDHQASKKSHVPQGVRDRVAPAKDAAIEAWQKVPGSDGISQVVSGVMEGGYEALTDAVIATLQTDRIVARLREKGHPVDSLDDLASLDLKAIDAVKPKLNNRYAMTSAASGAAAGFVAGGGTMAIAGTGGVAAAPGAFAITGAMSADIVATLGALGRSTAHYGGYYGFDPRDEAERAVLLGVIGVGTAAAGAARQQALLQVRQISMMVARRATWEQLGKEGLVKIVQRIFERISVRLTKQKLGQALPIAGIAIGSSLNYSLVRRVATSADMIYRERFLDRKYGLYSTESISWEIIEATEDSIRDSTILDAEIIEPPGL